MTYQELITNKKSTICEHISIASLQKAKDTQKAFFKSWAGCSGTYIDNVYDQMRNELITLKYSIATINESEITIYDGGSVVVYIQVKAIKVGNEYICNEQYTIDTFTELNLTHDENGETFFKLADKRPLMTKTEKITIQELNERL